MSIFSKLSIPFIFVAFIGCASSSPAPKSSADKSVPGTAQSKDTTNEDIKTSDWSISVPAGWDVLPTGEDAKTNLRIELLARSGVKYGKIPASMAVISTVGAGDEKQFIMNTVRSLEDSTDIKILDGKVVKVSGHPGALLMMLRKQKDGNVVGNFVLVTGNGIKGYTLICGGDPQGAEGFGQLCIDSLFSFKMK